MKIEFHGFSDASEKFKNVEVALICSKSKILTLKTIYNLLTLNCVLLVNLYKKNTEFMEIDATNFWSDLVFFVV